MEDGMNPGMDRYGILIEVIQEITRLRRPEEVGQRIVEAAVRFTGGVASLWRPGAEAFLLTARAGEEKPGRESPRRLPFDQGLLGVIVRTKAPLQVSDVQADPRFQSKAWAEAEGLHGFLGLPLFRHDRLMGILNVFRRERGPFDPLTVELLQALGAQAAISLENAGLHEALQQEKEQKARILEVAEALNRNLPSGEILEFIAQKAAEVTGAEKASLYEYDPKEEVLKVIAVHQMTPAMKGFSLKPGESVTGRAASWRKPIAIPDVLLDTEHNVRLDVVLREGVRAFLSLPLFRGEDLVGALSVYHTHPHPFSPEEVETLKLYAPHAALALQNARLFQMVKAARDEWQRTFDALVDPVALLDGNGRIRRANQALAARLGLPAQDLTGQRCCEVLFGGEPCPAHHPLVAGEPFLTEMEIWGGTYLIGIYPMREEGRIIGAAFAARDITEKKLLDQERVEKEKLEAINRHKSEFLATMSHELRTPLNSIIGFSELLQDQTFGPLNEKQARYVDHILTSGRHLLALINDLLDLSKVEAGRLELRPEAFDLREALAAALQEFRPQADAKGVTLHLSVDEALTTVTADPVRFKQILFNLLSNAVKFTPEGGRITLKAEVRSEKLEVRSEDSTAPPPFSPLTSHFVEISVQDTGIGIKPEDLPRLFQPFTQLEPVYAKRYQGTGLGLALTKRLVELHGGTIWAESEGEGRGSTFTIRLPWHAPSDHPPVDFRPETL